MASSAYVNRLLAGLPSASQSPLTAIFQYLLSSLRIGRIEPGETVVNRGANLQLYPLTAVTPAVANTEFSIPHGLPTVPYLLLPVLPLDQVGAGIVPLTVTRAADATRIYLSSSVTSATIYVSVEG